MAKCARCRINYPPGLISPVYGRHNYSGAQLCGICALACSNELHNQHNEHFVQGILSNTMIELAKAFRERHPKTTPHSNQTPAHWVEVPKKQ